MNIANIINPIKRKLFYLVGKSLLTAINNEGKTGFYDSGTRANPQRISTNWFGNLTDIERSQPFGLETHPIIGTSKGVYLSPDGSRSNVFCIMIQDDEYRPTDIASGDTCLYNSDDLRVWLEGGKLRIKGATANVVVEDGDVVVEKGDAVVKLGDALVETGDAIVGPNSISFLNHFHLGNLSYNTGIPVVGAGTPKPAGAPSGDASGNIDMNNKDVKTIGAAGTDYSTHGHEQPADTGGDTEAKTNAPS
jgi:phage gp45-like